jgi:outer membrane protein OmpA-like peptidoglycan-associated protein
MATPARIDRLQQRSVTRRGAFWPLLTALALALTGMAAVTQANADGKPKAGSESRLAPLGLSIDPDRVDLEQGTLELRTTRPAVRVTLKVLDVSGKALADVEQRFDASSTQPLTLRWRGVSAADVARIEVYAYDKDDYYKGLAITPWSFVVPHEEVVFETDSAEIRASEVPKLQASAKLIRDVFARHRSLGPIRLFIAGHTDTQGGREHNLALSARRARAIAGWFRKNGLSLPIAYQGFGEQALKVVTGDEVDESKNRRVDYLLGIEPPRFKVSGLAPSWSAL